MAFSWTVGMKNRCNLYYEKLVNFTEQPGNLIPLDRGEVVPVFRWDMCIVYGGVDFDDPTTNVWGRRALAIAKPTLRGYWPRRSTINLTTRVYFLQANEEQARNWICNLDIANIRGKLYWWRWGSVTPLSGRGTQTKNAKLQLWRTFNLNKTQV